MESAVLDEYFSGVPAPGHHSSKVNPLHIAFQCFWVQLWLARLFVQAHPQTFDEREIWVVACQRKHVYRRD